VEETEEEEGVLVGRDGIDEREEERRGGERRKEKEKEEEEAEEKLVNLIIVCWGCPRSKNKCALSWTTIRTGTMRRRETQHEDIRLSKEKAKRDAEMKSRIGGDKVRLTKLGVVGS